MLKRGHAFLRCGKAEGAQPDPGRARTGHSACQAVRNKAAERELKFGRDQRKHFGRAEAHSTPRPLRGKGCAHRTRPALPCSARRPRRERGRRGRGGRGRGGGGGAGAGATKAARGSARHGLCRCHVAAAAALPPAGGARSPLPPASGHGAGGCWPMAALCEAPGAR